MYRTHSCGELTEKDIGKEATLCGWVGTRRDHGKLIFIDIRDRWGLTQVVFLPKKDSDLHARAQELRSEYVIQVRGKVKARPKGTENPNLKTGKVELEALELVILNPAETPPFEIDDNAPLSEETRFIYRYLDLRRPSQQGMLLARHRFCKSARDILDEEGFVEVETPILTKSTPEGARDYLVPSRPNAGKFYALPQSPQLFKQILMVAGLEKYFQIAKCFRDEDLRADRQPEFTQLDIEMSFVAEEDIYELSERILQRVFRDVLGSDIKIPFPRITYVEAMKKYQTDKPDLRGETGQKFAFVWVTDFPLLKYNQDEKRWEMEHHPFTSCKDEDLALLDKDPSKARARAYDIVLNGAELGSGSIRIHRRAMQEKIFQVIGIGKKEMEERFGFLLKAFSFGAPPHGGIAFGIDRLIAMMMGRDTIRDVIAFPKTQKAVCPMTDAPSDVDPKQLKELKIKVT